ncbi:transglutaminase domain-containing protein [candidate division KSB1 bacterium]|nr:transglutaminase domain-containing protein [candidate division KSB1 bacterium]
MQFKKVLQSLPILLILCNSQFVNSQNFELGNRFYYKIEKGGYLIGYAEEHLYSVKELPNLEVRVDFTTVIKDIDSSQDFVKQESYLVDMTYDKLRSGKVSYRNHRQTNDFELDIDFRHHRLTKNVGENSNINPLPTTVWFDNHRFFSVSVERKLDASVLGGEIPFLWTDTGIPGKAFWKRLPDTTLIVNNIRMMCQHIEISKKPKTPLLEFWTLKNSGRLIRMNHFANRTTIELANERYKNCLEYPFDITKSKPPLSYLKISLKAQTDAPVSSLESRFVPLDIDSMNTFPLDKWDTDQYPEYMAIIQADQLFDTETVVQTSLATTKRRKYLDDILDAFTRWTLQQTRLNLMIKKPIDKWQQEDIDILLKSLVIFTNLCRASGIPARIIEGVYCLSPIESICYRWLWIEIFDGKRWYPWHIYFTYEPFGDAAFLQIEPTNYPDVMTFRLERIDSAGIESYQFMGLQSLTR